MDIANYFVFRDFTDWKPFSPNPQDCNAEKGPLQCGAWSILNRSGKAGLNSPVFLQVGGMDLQRGFLSEG